MINKKKLNKKTKLDNLFINRKTEKYFEVSIDRHYIY